MRWIIALVLAAMMVSGCGNKQVVTPRECNALRSIGMDAPTPDITAACGVLPLVKDAPITLAHAELAKLECRELRPVADAIFKTVDPLIETLLDSERPFLRLAGNALKATFAGPRVYADAMSRPCTSTSP